MKIDVSIGEVYDKLSILDIKKELITDKEKLKHVNHEYSCLSNVIGDIKANESYIDLYVINRQLWRIEDELRKLEEEQAFDESFVQLARHVYKLNDKRYKIKNEINIKHNSDIREQKEHK